MSKYMWVLLFSGALPLFLSFYPPLRFYRNFKALLKSILLILLIFGSWDIFAVWRGHWYFNPSSVWQLKVINLPLEEVLFFVVIPFCCIFTWEALKFIRAKLR
ncbi:MAG: lycopene cyclase domain-containing protein [Candidatus Omnitrophica bacterium]|nr:lycopene cyclase domain-containing protein [Candidatus Omnitrophota bacterium]